MTGPMTYDEMKFVEEELGKCKSEKERQLVRKQIAQLGSEGIALLLLVRKMD